MGTFQELKNSIETDLHRTDRSADVSAAISSAIRYYERERWWFLEGTATFTTSASQVYYSVPSDAQTFPDTLLVTISGSKEPVLRKTYSEIDEIDSVNYTGIPNWWCYYKDKIRLYPVPNDNYVMTLSYHKGLTELTPSASNSWTTEARDLIKYRAEWLVYKNVLWNPERAKEAKQCELDEYRSIMSQNTRRISSGTIRKHHW